MVPIYLPAAAVVPHAVLEEEKRIIQEEGWWTVASCYYANAFDADKMRRLEAERRVAEKARLDRVCAWCERLILEGEPTVEIAWRKVHVDPCALEFDAWIAAGKDAIKPAMPMPEPPAPPVPLEQQLRKSIELGRIQDDDLVEWGSWVDVDTPNERYEREMVRWGDLLSYERHMVERLEDGRLVGGYPM